MELVLELLMRKLCELGEDHKRKITPTSMLHMITTRKKDDRPKSRSKTLENVMIMDNQDIILSSARIYILRKLSLKNIPVLMLTLRII